jgi:hypothetical protein
VDGETLQFHRCHAQAWGDHALDGAGDGEGHRRQFGAAHLAISFQEAINRFVAEANTEPKPFH